MEAPKKIYLTKNLLGELRDGWDALPSEEFTNIEYIRKDAFIEKACEWLKENFSFDEAGYCKTNIYSTKSMIYNFKNTLGSKL